MSVAQCQQLYELQKRVGLIKGKKTPESSSALEARAKPDNSSNEILFPDIDKPKPSSKNNLALDRKGNGTRQSQTDA